MNGGETAPVDPARDTATEASRDPGEVVPREVLSGLATSESGDFRLEWYLARRYLSSRRGKGLLSFITLIAIGGVSVGVMALIVVIGVMTGLQNDLREKILGASPHGMVLTVGDGFVMQDWQGVLQQIRAEPEVVSAAPFTYTEVLLTAGDAYAEGAVFRGVADDPESIAVSGLAGSISAGNLPFVETQSGNPGLVVGRGLADRLGLYIGREVVVLSFQGADLTPTGMMPQMRRFEVTGIFQTGLFQYDTKFTYVALEEAQALQRLGDGVTGVEFNIADPWEASQVAGRLGEKLGFPYSVRDWQQQNASLFSALKLEKLAMLIILLLIVLVASFNIVSTLVMVVADKTREIGILRSMGLQARSVRRVFQYMGLAIGLVGTAVGATLGFVLAELLRRYQFIELPHDIYFVDRLPIELAFPDIAMIVGASILIAFIATIYPAKKAAELQPVDAIRNE